MEQSTCLEFEWSKPEQSFDNKNPSGRQGSALCCCGDFLYMFGGRIEGKERLYSNDLWKRRVGALQSWEPVICNDGPSKRHNHTMVCHDGHCYLFGGAMHGELNKATKRFDQVYLNDLWRVVDDTWERVQVEQAPCVRHQHTMVAVGKNKSLLFGGFGGDQKKYLNDLWLLEDNEWSELHPVGQVPKARAQHSSCVCRGRLYIFGGYIYSGKEVYLNDLYSISLEDLTWTKHETKNCPSPRNRAVLFSYKKFLILFNGNYYASKRGTDEW